MNPFPSSDECELSLGHVGGIMEVFSEDDDYGSLKVPWSKPEVVRNSKLIETSGRKLEYFCHYYCELCWWLSKMLTQPILLPSQLFLWISWPYIWILAEVEHIISRVTLPTGQRSWGGRTKTKAQTTFIQQTNQSASSQPTLSGHVLFQRLVARLQRDPHRPDVHHRLPCLWALHLCRGAEELDTHGMGESRSVAMVMMIIVAVKLTGR